MQNHILIIEMRYKCKERGTEHLLGVWAHIGKTTYLQVQEHPVGNCGRSYLCVVVRFEWFLIRQKNRFQRGTNPIGPIRYGDYTWILSSHENESITAGTMDNWGSIWQEEASLKAGPTALPQLAFHYYQGLGFMPRLSLIKRATLVIRHLRFSQLWNSD